ncbi:hypothetical protein ABT299_02935 [Spirillospora sp. NPDC000708]
MFLAQIVDVGAGGLEDPQPEQPEHRHQREIDGMGRCACGRQQSLELQMESPSVGKFGWDVGAADVVGGRVLENPVDHAGAVEARHY